MAQDAAWDGEARTMRDWPTCVKVAADGVLSSSMGLWQLMKDYPINMG